jgi:hypothetical protein
MKAGAQLLLGGPRSVMKKPWFLRGIRVYGGWGKAPSTIHTVLFSGQGPFHHPARRRDVPQRKGRAVGERVGVLADEELVVRLSSS